MKAHESKEFLVDLVYNSTYNFIFLFEVEPNNQFRCLAVNNAYLKVINQLEHNIIGKTIKDIWPSEKAKFFTKHYNEAISSRDTHTYEISYNKPGHPSIVESTITPIFNDDGDCIYIFGTSKDVTGRKQAEDILKKSEANYRTLFNNSLDGIYKSTNNGRFVDVNPALVKMLGYASREELLEIDIKTQLYFEEKDRKIMASNEKDEYLLKKKDGSKIWVEDHGHYEYDEDGEILFHHGILRDVTLKIEKQNELKKLLEITNNQNKRLQGFAHIVSHNIRSHSSNMSAIVDFMEDSKDPTESQQFFKMLKTSAGKLQETIGNLNEIITIHQDAQKAYVNKNLNAEVEDTLDVLNGEIKTHAVQVETDINKNIELHVIPAYLDSILLNLLSNAIKYRSKDRPLVIKISASNGDNYTSLSIADNGVGIDLPRFSEKLFGMYQTFHDNQDARGFGLYITKNEIEAMDGEIKVTSTPNQGTCFTVKFKKQTVHSVGS